MIAAPHATTFYQLDKILVAELLPTCDRLRACIPEQALHCVLC
jgi:hypothetical protein